MKRIVSALLALLLGLLTGCSYLPEDIAVAIEEEADKFAEDFKNEVVDAVRDEFLAEVSGNGKDAMPKPKATPVPAEEEEHATEERILTPTIEYRGITYTPHMTVTAEELYEWIPDLEKIDISISGPWTFKHFDDPYYYLVVRPWEHLRTSAECELFLDQFTYGDPNAERHLARFEIDEDGASSNGIYIGDPAASVLKTFPEAYSEKVGSTDTNYYVYFYNGETISYDEVSSMRKNRPYEDEYFRFEEKYDVYVIRFCVRDESVDCIAIYDHRALLYGN